MRGRIEAPYDGRARATCRTSAADGTRARWRQYRSIWSFVEDDGCRRAAILRHFGDPATPAPIVACCDVCDPECVADVTSIVVSRGGRTRPQGNAANIPAADLGDLDAAILDVVERAQPSVGRTRAVEILRGGRSKVVAQHGYDGLPAYGAFAGVRADDVLARVDELLDEGRLVSTGGPVPEARRGGVAAGSCASSFSCRAGGRTSRRSSTPSTAARSRSSASRATGPARPRSRSPPTPGIPTAVFLRDDYEDRTARDLAIGDWALAHGAELVVLAGLHGAARPPSSSLRFPDRIVNVHPSLLPAFGGIRAIEQAIDHGVKVVGVTVHLVDEGVDTGAILLQRAIPMPDTRDPSVVHAALQPIEHELLPEGVRLLAAGRVRRDPDDVRRVVIAPAAD